MNQLSSLEELTTMIPVLKAAIPLDLSIAVCDTEKFIAYWPSDDIDLRIQVNQRLKPEEPLSHAILHNEALRADVPAEFYGFAFTGTAMPIQGKDGKVIGGIAVQMRRHSELRDISARIFQMLNLANDQLSSIAGGSNELAETTEELLELARGSARQVQKIDGVLNIVKEVGDQTNLLGINAAIEAAHAGEHGRGFGVVAGEIRRLSTEAVSSTKTVQETLGNFRESTLQIEAAVEQIAKTVQQQAGSSQQVSAFIQEIHQLAEDLVQFARRL